jgi:hypothetical protein
LNDVEGRRKKEEGRGLYMWIQDPKSKLNDVEGRRKKEEGRRKKEEGRRKKEEVYICGYRTPSQKGFLV